MAQSIRDARLPNSAGRDRLRSVVRGSRWLGACPTLTVLLRRTIRDHLRRARPEKILNVFQRIHLRFFRACGLASDRTSFASSRTAMSDRLLARAPSSRTPLLHGCRLGNPPLHALSGDEQRRAGIHCGQSCESCMIDGRTGLVGGDGVCRHNHREVPLDRWPMQRMVDLFPPASCGNG